MHAEGNHLAPVTLPAVTRTTTNTTNTTNTKNTNSYLHSTWYSLNPWEFLGIEAQKVLTTKTAEYSIGHMNMYISPTCWCRRRVRTAAQETSCEASVRRDDPRICLKLFFPRRLIRSRPSRFGLYAINKTVYCSQDCIPDCVL